jgi:threonine/homoserine/homoserine lactone efflux protein
LLAIFLEGVVFGLILTIMLGPIFIALTQTGIDKGARAGITVGLGVWSSDLLVILFSYLFISQVDALVQDEVFKYWMGLVGGFILITFGIVIFLKKTKSIKEGGSFTVKNYFGFWMKGFLVNTVNPFTFIFWLGVISTKVIGINMNDTQAFVFISAIMLTIIITDTIKVLGAKAIRGRLESDHLQRISRVAGAALVVFGIVLLYQTGNKSFM